MKKLNNLKAAAAGTRARNVIIESLESRQLLSAAPVSGPIKGHGLTFAATENVSFTGATATFSKLVLTSSEQKSAYAVIDWGDGTYSTSKVTADAKGGYDAIGTHTYADPGFFGVDTSIVTSPFTNGPIHVPLEIVLAQAHGHADVHGPSHGVTLHPTVGQSFTDTVGTLDFHVPPELFYTDSVRPDFLILETVYDATINWGDGKTTTGTFADNAGGNSDVIGAHTYKKAGDFAIHIVITAHQEVVGPIGPIGPIHPLSDVVVGPTPIDPTEIVATLVSKAIVSKA